MSDIDIGIHSACDWRKSDQSAIVINNCNVWNDDSEIAAKMYSGSGMDPLFPSSVIFTAMDTAQSACAGHGLLFKCSALHLHWILISQEALQMYCTVLSHLNTLKYRPRGLKKLDLLSYSYLQLINLINNHSLMYHYPYFLPVKADFLLTTI